MITNKKLKAELQPGDRLVQALGIKRLYHRIYRGGRFLMTISKRQFDALSTQAIFVKYNRAGTKRILQW